MNNLLLLTFLQGIISTVMATSTKTSNILRIKPTPSAEKPQKSGIGAGYQVDISTVANNEEKTLDAATFTLADISRIEFFPYHDTTAEEDDDDEQIIYMFDKVQTRSTNVESFYGQIRNSDTIGECNILHQGYGKFFGSINAGTTSYNLSMRADGTTYWIVGTEMNSFHDD